MSQLNNYSTYYAPYGWIITEDYVASDLDDKYPSDVGLTGPRNISPEIEKRLKGRVSLSTDIPDDLITDLNGTMVKFKMLDADGNLYYVGWIDGEYDLTEPLDDFGTPNAGAIYLKVLEPDGSWSSAVEAF